jgi:hypothetical protein
MMTPQDVIWRVLERLRENQELLGASIEELHPVRHQDLISALHELEQLTSTQINLMNRMRRRYPPQ